LGNTVTAVLCVDFNFIAHLGPPFFQVNTYIRFDVVERFSLRLIRLDIRKTIIVSRMLSRNRYKNGKIFNVSYGWSDNFDHKILGKLR